mgnify:CR=1 FL=1
MSVAHSQDWHEKHNATHYPGTRQLCFLCDRPTERCEEDEMRVQGVPGPLCLDCYRENSEPEKGPL